MRFSFFVLAACCLTASLHAASSTSDHPVLTSTLVPLDHVTWQSDNVAPPSALGLARRVQVYVLVDMANPGDPGAKTYNHIKDAMLLANYRAEYRVLHIAITVNLNPPVQDVGTTEAWSKARDGSDSLLRAFAGDAPAAMVVVDGRGKVQSIARLTTSAKQEATKDLEKLFVDAQPIAVDDSQFPATLKPALKLLRYGDVIGAIRSAQVIGAEALPLVKSVGEQAKAMIDDDARTAGDKLADPGLRLIAWQRLNDMLAEDPTAGKSTLVANAIKQVKGDKDLAREQAAWAAFQEYLKTMQKVPLKNVAEAQLALLGAIVTKCKGTYAANVATMIAAASAVTLPAK